MAPPQGWVKANWDAAIEKKSGWVGLGVIIRDHRGSLVAAKCVTRKGFVKPVAAEAWAALMALQLSRDLGLLQVYLEGDAKIVVDTVNSTEPDWSWQGHLVDDIQVELLSFPNWKLNHVRREAN